VSAGIVDTTVVLHYFRKSAAAQTWVDSQSAPLLVTTVTWMEVMGGTSSKAHQRDTKSLLHKFELVYPTPSDWRWAMEQVEKFQFSHRIGKDDCLIAAVAYRLQLPLYTHNLKHMTPLIGTLAVKPYA
jgi:predicted nucleic acid-binding protein